MTRTRGDEYQGELKVGQRVHSILYGGRDGVIYAIEGGQRPDSISGPGLDRFAKGGMAMIRVVFEDHQMYVPESAIKGVQWLIMGEIVSRTEVEKALAEAAAAEDTRIKKQLEIYESRVREQGED